MEMAEQLIGVTMQEQGVSRIVAVDMESAAHGRYINASKNLSPNADKNDDYTLATRLPQAALR